MNNQNNNQNNGDNNGFFNKNPIFIFAIFAIVIVLAFRSFSGDGLGGTFGLGSNAQSKMIAYSEFKDMLKNKQLNEVKFNKIWTGSIANLEQKYDIVVANIIADVIFMLSNDLKKSLKKGGYLVLSGILNKYEDRIKDTFKDLELVEIKRANDWVSFVYKEMDE